MCVCRLKGNKRQRSFSAGSFREKKTERQRGGEREREKRGRGHLGGVCVRVCVFGLTFPLTWKAGMKRKGGCFKDGSSLTGSI